MRARSIDYLARRFVSTVLIAALVGAGRISAQSSPPSADGIIERLTMETRDQAIACGRAGIDCAVAPYALCPLNGRYAARIATPYSRVASAVYEALKAGGRPNPMTPGAATRWGVGVFVFPAEDSANAESIQRLEIRREGRVIRPTTSTVGPISARMPDGATKQLTRGFFAFPFDAFAPTADVTVIFVGLSGETACTLERSRLQALR
jgi:hypothetical protein